MTGRWSSRWTSRSGPTSTLPDYTGPEGEAAGQDDHRGRRRRPVAAVPRALRPDRAQAGGGRRDRRLPDRRPDLPQARRQRAQRGQGDPVPAPARAAVPGRPHSRARQGVLEGTKPARPARSRPARHLRRPIPPCAGRRPREGSGSRPEAAPPARGQPASSTRSASTASTSCARPSRDALERRIETQQRQAAPPPDPRRAASPKTPFDLPADLVARQEKSTIRRLIMDLRQEGFTDNEIRAREAEIRANAHEMTLRSLKEFFSWPGSPRPRRSRSRTRTSRSRSRPSPSGPARAPAGSAPGSRRKAWPTPSPPRSSSARPSTASSSTVKIEDVAADEPRDDVETAGPGGDPGRRGRGRAEE